MRVPIDGYEGFYEINEDGEVFNIRTGKTINGNINCYGYRVIRLTKCGKPKDYKLHQLVARAFIPNPNNYKCVNHIDGNKDNNSVDNLEWCTHASNINHARTTLRLDFSRKPVMQTTLDGKLVAVWTSANIAAHYLKGHSTMIAACCKGTSDSAYGCKWRYLDQFLINS